MHRYVICVAQDLLNLEVFLSSLIDGTVEIHHQTPHEIEVRHNQLLGLEPELLIMNEMMSD